MLCTLHFCFTGAADHSSVAKCTSKHCCWHLWVVTQLFPIGACWLRAVPAARQKKRLGFAILSSLWDFHTEAVVLETQPTAAECILRGCGSQQSRESRQALREQEHATNCCKWARKRAKRRNNDVQVVESLPSFILKDSFSWKSNKSNKNTYLVCWIVAVPIVISSAPLAWYSGILLCSLCSPWWGSGDSPAQWFPKQPPPLEALVHFIHLVNRLGLVSRLQPPHQISVWSRNASAQSRRKMK